MNRRATRLLAALLPIPFFLAPVAASAASLTVDDGVGDAKAINLESAMLGSDGPFFLAAPAETSTDIVRTTIDHASKRLTITVQFRDLVDIDDHTDFFRVFTPKGRYDLMVASFDGQTIADLSPSRGGMTAFEDGVSTTVTAGGSKPCRTVRSRFDLAADTLTVSAPTKCLGSPNWVQVAAVASRFKATPVGDGSVNLAGYVDDAFRGGVSDRSMSRSPKVRRG